MQIQSEQQYFIKSGQLPFDNGMVSNMVKLTIDLMGRGKIPTGNARLVSFNITVYYNPTNDDPETGRGWWAEAEFQDTLASLDSGNAWKSVKGKIETSHSDTLPGAIDAILMRCSRMGVKFIDSAPASPLILYDSINENRYYPAPRHWQHLLKREAERINFINLYDVPKIKNHRLDCNGGNCVGWCRGCKGYHCSGAIELEFDEECFLSM